MAGWTEAVEKVGTGAVVVASLCLRALGDSLPEGGLSEEEAEGLKRFRHGADGRRHAWGRAVARMLLAERCGLVPSQVPLKVDLHGKPYVEGSEEAFNIAHSGEGVLVAMAGSGAVGVDIEAMERRVKAVELARHFFHPGEVAYIEAEATARDARFFQIWTAKEAYCKAVGLGLGLSLRRFCVEPVSPREGRVVAEAGPLAAEAGPRRILWFRPWAGYLAALCMEESMGPVVSLELCVADRGERRLEVRSVRPLADSGD